MLRNLKNKKESNGGGAIVIYDNLSLEESSGTLEMSIENILQYEKIPGGNREVSTRHKKLS